MRKEHRLQAVHFKKALREVSKAAQKVGLYAIGYSYMAWLPQWHQRFRAALSHEPWTTGIDFETLRHGFKIDAGGDWREVIAILWEVIDDMKAERPSAGEDEDLCERFVVLPDGLALKP